MLQCSAACCNVCCTVVPECCSVCCSARHYVAVPPRSRWTYMVLIQDFFHSNPPSPSLSLSLSLSLSRARSLAMSCSLSLCILTDASAVGKIGHIECFVLQCVVAVCCRRVSRTWIDKVHTNWRLGRWQSRAHMVHCVAVQCCSVLQSSFTKLDT